MNDDPTLNPIDLDLLANAVADSLTMPPRRWLAKYGGIRRETLRVRGYEHLLADYKESLAEMLGRVPVIKANANGVDLSVCKHDLF
ncbi:hypothetical protein [Aliagarivorans taiwanensis]|uniref:hypothetical protein n=1 Tax=Aliagarivorans taiwanensis TaxID=561966 RepID=UPI00047AD7E8|nr:hypothetical protein [Aliagarivorans taiwanensis]